MARVEALLRRTKGQRSEVTVPGLGSGDARAQDRWPSLDESPDALMEEERSITGMMASTQRARTSNGAGHSGGDTGASTGEGVAPATGGGGERPLPGNGPGLRPRVISFSDIQVDPSTHVVRKGGRMVDLTPKEFELLLALARREGAVASRPELLREVWNPRTPITSRTVDTHLFELRRKLEDDPSNPRHLLTVRKVGYRLQPH
ncbi:MAG: winged helix family transcriptional regulator [Gemmatimonadales bacterium]|nr:MAG: winged helix family transcriptional regulator [Gemmatimonadales bacterium]